MKAKIKQVLDRHKDSQGNLASDSFRDMLAVEIECNITKDSMAKNNPLSIEMWKGYIPEWKGYKPTNPNQMEIKFDE